MTVDDDFVDFVVSNGECCCCFKAVVVVTEIQDVKDEINGIPRVYYVPKLEVSE